MPISDRKFNIKWIIDQNEKQEAEAKKEKGEIGLEDLLNKKKNDMDYVTKAATKKQRFFVYLYITTKLIING